MSEIDLSPYAVVSALTHRERKRLASYMDRREASAGEELCTEGQEVHELMFVRQGRIQVVTSDSVGGAHVLCELAAPTVVGEVELMGVGPCAATIVAVEPCAIDLLPHGAFEALLDEGDAAAVKLMRAIGRITALRLQAANKKVAAALEVEELRALQEAQANLHVH